MTANTVLWSDFNEYCAVHIYYEESVKRILVAVIYNNEKGAPYAVCTHIPDLLSGIKLCMDLASGKRSIDYFLDNKDYYLKKRDALNVF